MNKKILTTIGLTALIIIALSLVAHAYTIDPTLRPENEPFQIEDEIQQSGASGATIIVLQIIAGGLLYFAAPVAVILIASAGFQIVTGGSESEKIEQGKKNLTWSIIGLLVIIFSYAIVRYVIAFVLKAASVASN